MVDPEVSSIITKLNGASAGSKCRIGRRTPSSKTAKSFADKFVIELPCLSTTPTLSWTRAVSETTTSSWAHTPPANAVSASTKMNIAERQQAIVEIDAGTENRTI